MALVLLTTVGELIGQLTHCVRALQRNQRECALLLEDAKDLHCTLQGISSRSRIGWLNLKPVSGCVDHYTLQDTHQ